MRTKLFTFIATLVASAGVTMAQTPQDVTSSYLSNTGFDTEPITFIISGKNPDATRLYGTGWVYTLPSWKSESIVVSNAVQIASAVYGYSGASSEGLNGTNPPAADGTGNSTGACVHMSAGWGDKAIITQQVTGLSAGKYRLSYDAYNASSATTIVSNFFGYVPTTGTATYGTKKSYTFGNWETETVDFIIAKEGESGKISLGCITSSGGSASGAKLYIDNVKLYYIGIDKTDLNSKIKEAEALYGDGTGKWAADLNLVISTAKKVNADANATMADVAGSITDLTYAIRSYQMYNASKNNITFILKNPDFNDGTSGWITNMGIWGATSGQNTMYTGASSDPNPVLDKGATGHIYGYQTFEKLPAGAYQLNAVARGQATGGPMQIFINNGTNENNTNGTAEKTVSVNRIGDTGGPLNYGFASYSTEILTLTAGEPLTLGVRVENGTVNAWQSADAFELYFYPELGSYYSKIIEDLEEILRIYDVNQIPSGNNQDIQAALKFSEENSQSTNAELLKEVADSLSNALNHAKAAEAIMTQLGSLIDEANSYMELGYSGRDKLEIIFNKTLTLMEFGATLEDGSFVYAKDLEIAMTELKDAIHAYRFTEPITNPEAGIDCTWALQSPDFTKEGGDPSISADATSKGWTTDNVSASGDYRLNLINGKNCWNNWSNNFTSMNVYQELAKMPAGYYTFECLQTNNGPEVTDQHAYITALGGTANSPYATYTQVTDPETPAFANAKWELLKTGKILVGNDGKLKVGFASTSNGNGASGWFCFTGCVLKYYGPGSYADAMQSLIEEAENLNESEMLKQEHNALMEAIEIAKNVDTSNQETANAGMLALNQAMKKASDAVKTMITFKKASYGKVLTIAENPEGTYSEEISTLMSTAILNMDEVLDKDTTTLAAYPGLTVVLDRYLSFVDAYQACYTYIDADLSQMFKTVLPLQVKAVNENAGKIEVANKNLIQYLSFAKAYTSCKKFRDAVNYTELQAAFAPLLPAQIEAVTNDVANVAPAKKLFTSLMSFCNAFTVGMDIAYAEDPIYDPGKVIELASECVVQLDIVKEDYTQSSKAETEINKLLADLRLQGVVPGENTEITSLVIINPGIDNSDNSICPNGWQVDLGTATNYTYSGGHWSGESVNYFLDGNDGKTGTLRYTARQSIGLQNGTYKLMAAARSSGAGAYIFAQVEDGIRKVEIPVYNDAGGQIWENAEEGSGEKFVNGGKGRGWSWVEITDINVNTNTMAIGCSTDSDELGGGTPWGGSYFSADDFKLFWISDHYYGVGIENVDIDPSTEFIAYDENGTIVVEGVEEYTIITLNGTAISANSQLAPGIYIVKSGMNAVKVIVK